MDLRPYDQDDGIWNTYFDRDENSHYWVDDEIHSIHYSIYWTRHYIINMLRRYPYDVSKYSSERI